MTPAPTPTPAPPRGGRDLRSAVVVGVGLLSVALVGLVWLPWLLVALLVALLVGGVTEVARAVRGIDRVIVATDDARIRDHAESFGAEVAMTAISARNGTERCAEAVANLGLTHEIVVNLQGDAPLTPAWFVEELVAAARGQLRTMTYAPELAGSDALVEQLVSHGVLPSLGHTNADAATVTASLDVAVEELSSAGFDGYTERATVTHLFNGMPPMHHRSPGPVAACLEAAAAGKAVVELISDGVHLDPAIVRAMFVLLGAEAIVLVTDSMAATGLPDGHYTLGPQDVVVSDGAARLAEGNSLAGGTATMLDVVRSAVEGGVPLEQAVLSATSVPAELVGLTDEIGALGIGFSADAVIVDRHFRLLRVYRNGIELAPNRG